MHRVSYRLAFTSFMGLATACAASADERPPPAMDALEVLADLTLIDGTCKNVVVDFGMGFRFADARGLPEAAIMPGGIRRPAFETVLRARRASFGADELCGEIARNYIEALPGSVTPIYTRGETRP